MSSEQSPESDNELVQRMLMTADARELILRISHQGIPTEQERELVIEAAKAHRHVLENFLRVYLREFARRARGEW